MRPLLFALTRLFPEAFRRQFGADLIEQLERDHGRAASRGLVRRVAFTIATAWDLVTSSLAERIDPAWANTDMDTSNTKKGGGGLMDDLVLDIRQAIRSLRRSPGFLAVAVVTLGLAIGANAGIFTVVDTVLLRPFPYKDADRLVHLGGSAPGTDMPDEFGLSPEFVVQYGEESKLLEGVVAYNDFTASLRAGDRVERVWMSAPTSSTFALLGVEPMLGRLPTADDEGDVILISHALWVSWFGAAPDVIGRAYQVAGGTRTVIGVMPEQFWFPESKVMLWIPVPFRNSGITPGRFGNRIVARVAEGVSRQALEEELTRLAQRLPERFGGSSDYADVIAHFRPVVRPFDAELLGGAARALWVLLGSVGIVLLIACANVGNLFLVRAERRHRDLAVRRAIGAGRGRLIRSQMAEALVVAGLAGGLAVLIAWVSVPVFLRAAPPDIPRLAEVHIGPATLLFTLIASVFCALVCGLAPALRASAPSLSTLRDGARGSTRGRHVARDLLVVGQTALALVLLIGSGLLVRSYTALRHVDPGYDVRNVFTFQIAPEDEGFEGGPEYARFHMAFSERIAALPGVESVGIVENVPLNEGTSQASFLTEAAAGGPDEGVLLNFTWTAGDYFPTMGIDLLRGRTFTRADQETQLGNAIVSRTAAERLWPGQNPIGRRLRRTDQEAWATVVGVVEDVMQYGFRDSAQPLVYLPLVGPSPDAWVISSPAYVVKTSRADVIAPEIRALAHEMAPSAPMYRVFTMEGLAGDSMIQLSFTMLTLGVASGLAMLLGAIGLYGVLSYVVAERTQEIGVRMALGAEAAKVQRMVVGQGMRVVVIGVALGALVALAVTRALSTLLFGVGAADVGTFLTTSAAMVLIGVLASWLPARRASSVDPILSLRGE